MLIERTRFNYGPETGLEGQDFLDTIPREPAGGTGAIEIDPYSDYDYLVEGSPEAQAQQSSPMAGKTREEILAELIKAQEAEAAAKASADPVKALENTLSRLLQPQEKKPLQPGYLQIQQPMQPQSQETPEQRKQRMNDMFLQDPENAARTLITEQQIQMAGVVAQNQAQLSRELLLAAPETKKYYDRFAQEVESEVAQMPTMERFQNPRMYQTALERVKARHTDELVQETLESKIADAVAAKLKEMGLESGTPSGQGRGMSAPVRPTVPTGATQPGTRPPTQRPTVSIPPWVIAAADREGLDPKFYYFHLKEQGRI